MYENKIATKQNFNINNYRIGCVAVIVVATATVLQ